MVGVARRAKELSEELVKKGHKVTVITSYPRNFRSIPNISFHKKENINNVKVIRFKTFFSVGKNIFFRFLSYIFYVISSFNYLFLNRKTYDIMISMAPLPPAIAASVARILFKKYHHFDVPDILPDLGISAGMIKNKLLIKLLYKIEKFVYDNSDSISAITNGQIKNIENKGVSIDKIYFIPDWIDQNFFKLNLTKYKKEVSKNFNNKKKIIITFAGNIGALQNPEIFLDTMSLLKKEGQNKYQFVFIGDGIMLPSLLEKVKNNNIDNVEFLGRVKREHIPSYMNLSDILVANYLPNEYLDICIPGKIYEYAISNKPIIMGSKGEAKEIIEKYKLGIGVSPSNIEEFKNAIISLTDGDYKFKPRITSFEDDFSLKRIANSFNKILNQIN
jgi:glycosyltransferase involved in cell wall biosynthesis